MTRNPSFDIARAICMLYIVGIWHMLDYMDITIGVRNNFSILTDCVLSTFTLISGFFLGKKEMSIRDFYVKRLCRIYFLFLVASFIFLVVGYENISQFFFSITGLSNFILPQPRTLWYISMLLLFYFITPFIVNRNGIVYKKVNIGIKIIVVFLLFIVLDIFQFIDHRTTFYFFFYGIGILITENILVKRVMGNYLIFCIAIITFCLLYYLMTNQGMTGLTMMEDSGGNIQLYAIALTGVVIILSTSHMLSKILPNIVMKSLFIVSYSSMCVYLFHRIVYGILTKFVGGCPIDYYYGVIMVLIIIPIGYLVQKFYDKYTIPYLNSHFYK